MDAEELQSLAVRGQAGDLEAYGEIVGRFQDMAYGYAYAIMGDFHAAEDATQEAFVAAFGDLPKLSEAAAFPGWFRRVPSLEAHADLLVRVAGFSAHFTHLSRETRDEILSRTEHA